MAYSTSNPPRLLVQSIAGGGIWAYASADVHTDVAASGYFTNGYDLGMKVGDTVFVIETDNACAQTTHSVTVVTAGGAATLAPTLALGPELVVDGTFDDEIAGEWFGGGWAYNASQARATTAGEARDFNDTNGAPAEIGETYRCEFEVTSYTSGGVQIGFGGVLGTSRTAVGVYSEDLVAVDAGAPLLRAEADTTLFCDNVSVRKML